MAITLVTGATGLVGSHVARALLARGDNVRVTVPEHAALDAIADIQADVEVVVADGDRPRRAAPGASRRRSLLPRVRCDDAAHRLARPLPGQRDRHADRAGGGAARRRQRTVHTSTIAAIGPAEGRSTADETQGFNAARIGLAYANAKAEAEREALRVCAHGLPVVIVNPAHVLGRGDVHRSSTELVRRFLRREIPLYVDGALCIVGARGRRPRPPARRGARRRRRALHPGWAELHQRPLVRRPGALCRASSRRRSSCRCTRRWRWRGASRRCPDGRRSPSRRSGRCRCSGPTGRRRPSASWGGRRATTSSR